MLGLERAAESWNGSMKVAAQLETVSVQAEAVASKTAIAEVAIVDDRCVNGLLRV